MRHLPTFIQWTVAKFIYDHPHLKHKVRIETNERKPCNYVGRCTSEKMRGGYHHVLRFNLPNLSYFDSIKEYGAEDIILHECCHMLAPKAHHGKRFVNLCKKHGCEVVTP